MSRYDRQVVLCIGDAEPSLRRTTEALKSKWSAIKKRLPGNHTVVSIFKDGDNLQQLGKLIDNQSTRLYVLGHGVIQNNNLICGNHNIKSERLTSRELAKQLSQVIDQTKIGTKSNPLKINLLICFGGYAKENQKSFAENLIHALLDCGIHAEIIARESRVYVNEATGRKRTMTNTARDNLIENAHSLNPVTHYAATRMADKLKNLEHSVKFRYYAVKNPDCTYTVQHEKIIRDTQTALPPTSDELFLVLNVVLQSYKDRAPDHGDIKARLYCFFSTNPSKESLALYAALKNLTKTNDFPKTLTDVLNTHVNALKPNSILRSILYGSSLIDQDGKVNFALNPPETQPLSPGRTEGKV